MSIANAPWPATVITLFPEMFPGPLGESLAGKALSTYWSLSCTQIRNFAWDKHKTVDDTCYGSGGGMIMRPDIIHAALLDAKAHHPGKSPHYIYLSPKGRSLKQGDVKVLAQNPGGVVLLCGRYEGIDDRLIQYWREVEGLEEISIGDYVLSGGELAALVLLDACIRLIPGVLKNQTILENESFELDLLEFPQYTRPQHWNGLDVPSVLISGHHERIREWRLEQSEMITKERRPDLWCQYRQRLSKSE